MNDLENEVCSWQQGKQCKELGINSGSVFKWVHPYQLYKYIENKRKYILVEWYKTSGRSAYPAYTLKELLELLPDNYILGHLRDRWYCKDALNAIATIIYEMSAIKACINALIMYRLKIIRRGMRK